MKTKITSRRIGNPEPVVEGPDGRWVVVLNHHEARIFRADTRGTVPEQLRPRQSDDSIMHAHAYDAYSRGREKPLPNRFFGPVAAALKGAGRVLVFGSGKGRANEMNQFMAWIKTHAPDLARRILASLTIDAHHLTDGQILAMARLYHRPPTRAYPEE